MQLGSGSARPLACWDRHPRRFSRDPRAYRMVSPKWLRVRGACATQAQQLEVLRRLSRNNAVGAARFGRNTGFQPVRPAGILPAEAAPFGAFISRLEARCPHRLEACVPFRSAPATASFRLRMTTVFGSLPRGANAASARLLPRDGITAARRSSHRLACR